MNSLKLTDFSFPNEIDVLVDVQSYLEHRGAIVHGHFVGTKGGHMSVYVNVKDLAKSIESLTPLAIKIAYNIKHMDIDAIVGTPHGADTLAVLTAYYYRVFSGRDILILKMIKTEQGLAWYKDHGDDAKDKKFVFIEDVINTGGSVEDTANFIISSLAFAQCCVAVCSRLNKADLARIGMKIGVKINPLCVMKLENYSVDWDIDPNLQCPLCRQYITINQKIGHGKKFLKHIKDKFPGNYKLLSGGE